MTDLATLLAGSPGLGVAGLGDDSEESPQRRLFRQLLSSTYPAQAPDSLADPDTARSMAEGVRPAGFEESGLPSEYPATQSKEAAHDKLTKIEAGNPHAGRNALIKGAVAALGTGLAAKFGGTAAGAGAAHGMMQSEEKQYGRGQHERDVARQEYQFESSEEEKQREAAIREKVALTQIDATKAYRDLTIEMRKQMNQTRVRGQNLQAQEKGLSPDDQSSTGFTPINDPKQLALVDQAKLEHTKATTDYQNAVTNKFKPEEIELRRKALDVATQKLSVALQSMGRQNAEFEIKYGTTPTGDTQAARNLLETVPGAPSLDGKTPVGTSIFQRIGPTPTATAKGEQATAIQKAATTMIGDIQAHAKELGPVMGRFNSLYDFLGNPPPEYSETAARLTSFIALQPAAHGFRGLKAVQEFEKSIGKPIRTPEALIAAIQGTSSGIQPLIDVGSRKHLTTTPTGGGSKDLKKQGSGGGNTPPPGSKVVELKDFLNQ